MAWKSDGAVERGTISPPHNDLAEGAGIRCHLKANGFFARFPHLDTLAPLGLAVLIIAALLYIMAARTAHHFEGWHCRPGDVAGTNGRELCPPHGRPV